MIPSDIYVTTSGAFLLFGCIFGICIDALTFHVPAVFETKCEAASALGEHITLDDPFAEMTAPAEAGTIVKGDEVSPDPTELQDVFVCTVLFFLATESGS